MLALALAAVLTQSVIDENDPEQQAELKAQAERLAAMRKLCGKDYLRIAVGMRFARVRQCTRLEFVQEGETGFGQLWGASGGYVWVRRGIVTRWRRPPG